MKYSGKYGLVLLPDDATAKVACVHMGNLQNNCIDPKKHQPHLTLYHTKISNIDEDDVKDVLSDIKIKLPIKVRFTELSTFGDKFLFWDVECTSQLIQMHKVALQLSTWFQAEGEQQADTEKLQLSVEESQNVRSFGHPLVKNLWRPHITVGYVVGGCSFSERAHHDGVFTKVAFVEVGEWGTIERIVHEL